TPPAAPQPRVLPSHYSPPPSFTAPAPTEIYTLSLHDALPIYRTFRENAAFFAGSGGNRSILGTLSLVGWVRTWSQASYYYDLVHPETQETIEYIEGDLYAIDADATPHHL